MVQHASMKANSRPADRYVVVSSDTHAGADTYDYKPYLESRWHEEFDVWAAEIGEPLNDFFDGHAPREVNWDSEARLKILDAEGVTGEVLFPNTAPPFFEVQSSLHFPPPRTKQELERRHAGLCAHNRWLADFCGLSPDRRRGIIQVFPNDIELAVTEIRRAKNEDEIGVIGGVLLPVIAVNDQIVEPYFHPRYEPIWAVCEELGVPIHHHSGTGFPAAGADAPVYRALLIHEGANWPLRTLSHLIYSGVFERYPNLKFVMTELFGIRGILQELQLMDMRIPQFQSTSKDDPQILDLSAYGGEVFDTLSRTASEYWGKNCYTGASLLPRRDVEFIPKLGVDTVMWGTDFPHGEGVVPYMLEALQATMSDVPVEDLRRILGEVAAELYQFDLEKLAKVAERIGPKIEDVQRTFDLSRRPTNAVQFLIEEPSGALH